MHRSRRLLTASLGMLLCLAGAPLAVGATAPAQRSAAAPAERPTPTKPKPKPKPKPKHRKPAAPPTLAPASVIAGETVVATGRLRVDRRTPVQLQRRSAGTWVRVAATKAGRKGAYRFVVAAPATSMTYRVFARTHHSRARALAVLPQSGTLSLPPAAATDGTTVATFRPARPGRIVLLQQLDRAEWRDLGSAGQDADGAATFQLPIDLEQPATYRAVAVASRGAATLATAPTVLDVRPTSARIVAPASDALVSGSVPVRLDPRGVGGVTRVSVFSGGIPLGNAAAQPDGTWVARVDTLALANGRTDLSARVWTARGSRVVPAVRVRVANQSARTSSSLPEGFILDTVVGGLTLPTSFAVIDQHRTLVTEKDGLVRLVVDGQLRQTPVLDLSGAISNWWDQGLIGIALDPHFADNGWFYLTYVVKREGDPKADLGSQTLVRYTLTGETAPPASAHTVLGAVHGAACYDHPSTDDCIPIKGSSHTIDDMLFLADGSLLVSMGDGIGNGDDIQARMRAQDLDVLAGKVLRIDPATGRGYADNPFYAGDASANRSRVWAYGFRNPFRMTLSPDGEVVVADVGEASREELNAIPVEVDPGDVPVLNYGWPCLEGKDVENPLGVEGCEDILDGTVETVDPVYVYSHYYVGSATGGVFYTGDNYPEAYQGTYFFADYSYNVIWQIDLDAPDPGATFDYFATRPAPGAPVKFAMGPDGNVWYVSVTTGELRRIVYDPEGAVCPSDRFRGEYFSSPAPAADATPVLVTCETSLPTGPGLDAPPYVAGSSGFSVRWTGRPSMPGGAYAVHAASSGDLRVRVDGAAVPDGGMFRVAQSGVADATPEIQVSLSRTSDSDPGFGLSWTRQGTPPTVHIDGLLPGEPVQPGSVRAWTVSARSAAGPVAADDVVSTVSLLHYGSDIPHVHPSATVPGLGGDFRFSQDHASGATVFRIDARAVGPDGSVGFADPVYVCLVGNEVGPCAH